MTVEVSAQKATQLFKKHKELATPAIISATLSVILIIALLVLTGAYSLSTDLINLQNDWEQSELPITFEEYLELQGYDLIAAIENLLTWTNFWIIIGLFFVKLALSWYLGCLAWAMIAKIKKHSKDSIWNITNKYFFRYVGLHLVILIIIYIPFIAFLFGGLYMIFAVGNVLLGLGVFAIVGILLTIYMLGAIMRLIFTTPSLYDKNQGVTKTLTHAYHVTGHHFQHVLVVTLIAIALAFTAYYAGQNPAGDALGAALFSAHTAIVVLASLAVAIFVLIEAVIVTYERIFLYEAYHEHIKLK